MTKATCSPQLNKDTTTTTKPSPISAFLRFCGNNIPSSSSSSPPSISSATDHHQRRKIYYNPPPSNSTLDNCHLQHPSYGSSSSSSSSSRNSACSSTDDQEQEKHKLELQRVFTYFDENGDGKISASELQNCFRTVGGGELSDEDAKEAIRTSDADGDGMLGFDDFAKLMATGEGDDEIQELRDAFSMYSSSGSATKEECITPKSLKKMLTRLGKPATTTDCTAMIRKFDLNGDGVLNFDEFRVMMTR